MDVSEQSRLLDDVDAFCRALRPFEDRCYLERRLNDRLLPLACEHGLLGMPVPRAFGGRGADAVTYARALARIGREGTGVRTFFSGHSSLGQVPLLAWGTDDQKARYLARSVRGEVVFAFGLTEPLAGSNPRELRTTYRIEADRFVLNGTKYLISNGGIADVLIVFAYPEGGGRISAFLVETGGPGLRRQAIEPKVGNPTADTAEIALIDCAVPSGNLLGAPGDGLRIALATLVAGRLSVAAGCLGVIEDCLAEAAEYCRARSQHGSPIGRHQLVQQHVAAIELARVTTELTVLAAAQAKADADDVPADESRQARADLLAAQAKLLASRAACEAADHAVQVFGGRGFLETFRPGRHWQDARVCRIYEGTDEILILKIAASVLGKEFEAYHA